MRPVLTKQRNIVASEITIEWIDLLYLSQWELNVTNNRKVLRAIALDCIKFYMFSQFVHSSQLVLCTLACLQWAQTCVFVALQCCGSGRKGCGLNSLLIIVVFNDCSCCKLK